MLLLSLILALLHALASQFLSIGVRQYECKNGL